MISATMENIKLQMEENERINIEQDKDWIECLTWGIYTNNNIYHINTHPILTEQTEQITIQERSSFFCRLGCIFPRCRSYCVTMNSANNGEMLFIYDKPFGFPFMTWWRPDFKVFDHDETSIGSIQNVCSLWKIKMVIKDTDDTPIYEITGSMISPGYWWEPIWGSCFSLTFKIFDLRKDRYELAKIKKSSMGLFTDCWFQADMYDLELPPVMTYHERVLVWVAIHEIDMMYFERGVPCLC